MRVLKLKIEDWISGLSARARAPFQLLEKPKANP